MADIVIVKVGEETTGVYIIPTLEVTTIDFEKTLTPWDDKTIELIEDHKLVKIL